MNKRILFVLPRPPFPLESGGHHAQFHFIGAVMKKMDVSICFEVDDQNYCGYTSLMEIWSDATFYPLFNPKQKKSLLDLYRKVKGFIRNIKRRIF